MFKVLLYANNQNTPFIFDGNFLNECSMLSTYTDLQDISLHYSHDILLLAHDFYTKVVQNGQVTSNLKYQYKISLPVNTNDISNHIDQKSIEFINCLNYNSIFKPQTQKQLGKKTPQELIIIDEDKKQQVRQWLSIISELIHFADKLGFMKLTQILVISVSVPLFLPPRGDELYKDLHVSSQKVYTTVGLYNHIQQQIKQEFDKEWEKVPKVTFGWGQVQVPIPQDLLELEFQEIQKEKENDFIIF